SSSGWKSARRSRRAGCRIESTIRARSGSSRRWTSSPTAAGTTTRARDDMFTASDTPHAPWTVVPSDDKKRARLNIIHHILKTVPYKELKTEKIKFPKRQKRSGYRDPKYPYKYVKAVY